MNFSISNGSIVWLILSVVAAVALAAWAYRFALPALSRNTRGILWGLRSIAFVLLLLLLARPLLSLAERSDENEVILLEDISLSMDLPSGEANRKRAELAREAIEELEKTFEGRFAVRRWVFASEAQIETYDSLVTIDQAATALGNALRTVSAASSPVTVIVVSDGVANRGRDPVQAARELGAPVSSVIIGGVEGWDASLEEIAVNPTARAGQSTPMEVRLRHTGDAPRKARLIVSDRQVTLVQKEILLPAGGTEIIERLDFVPRNAGLSYYRVRLEAGPGEVVEDNNFRAVVQQVLPDRQEVLVLASSLQWDWTWFKRTVSADSAWSVSYGVFGKDGLESPPGDRAATPPSLNRLEKYAVIILQGLHASSINTNLQNRLAEYARRGGGLIFWGGPGGRGSDYASWVNAPLGQAFGIEISDVRHPHEVIPELPTGARVHDIVRLDDDLELNRRFFASLPPLTLVTPLASRPGDRILVSGLAGNASLLVLRRVGRGQVLLINGSGLWRWGFSGSDRSAPERYRRFWSHALRALAEPTQTEPLRVATDQPLLARGQNIGVSASLQDESFQPISGAEVEARWVAVGGVDGGPKPQIEPQATTLIDQGDGSYAGRRPPLPPGRYRVEAQAKRGGQVTATANSEFVVDTWSPEVQAVTPDRATLERMASVSGGKVVGVDEIDQLLGALESNQDAISNWREHRLWENPFFYLLIVGLLSSEWWMRRRRGLP